MVSNIPVAKAVSVVETDGETKDRLLFSLQIAVKQIQCSSSLLNPEDGALTADAREVHQLCESLDKTLFHGLRECEQGYWPFVKYFTHRDSVKFIESLRNARTEVQCGRAWLCLALNESSLESYFRSFWNNPVVVRKHYAPVAMLRDAQRSELLLMLMAGLENVPIDLDIASIRWGSGLSFFRCSLVGSVNRTPSRCSSEFSQSEFFQSPQLPVNNSTSDDVDSGVIELEYLGEVATEQDAIQASEKEDSTENCCENAHLCNLSTQEIERITKYINMALESEAASDSDLEVIRTKVVRRQKRSSPSHRKNTQCEEIHMTLLPRKQAGPHSVDTSAELKENRLSKTTTDSGLSVGDGSGSSSDCELAEPVHQALKSPVTFDVVGFQRELNVTFTTNCSTPIKPTSSIDSDDYSPDDSVGERGAPEGQEDPEESPQVEPDRQPLRPGSDGLDDVEEDEVSIYDISKAGSFLKWSVQSKSSDADPVPTVNEDNLSVNSDTHVTVPDVSEKPDTNPYIERAKSEDPVAEEIARLSQSMPQEIADIKADESTLFYFLVEVFEEDQEKFYKMFPGYLDFPKGIGHMALLLLTDRCLYTMKPGNSKQKFILCDSFLYRNIDFIAVHLNGQGFTVISKSRKQELHFFTADENLTGSILSNIEMAFRRFMPKQPLPYIVTEPTLQISNLKKFLSVGLKCSKRNVNIHHFSLARWEDYIGTESPVVTPAGPKRAGYLMYRHVIYNRDDAEKLQWCPGYFILNGGILYCMESDDETEPLFFVHIVADCKGCRRLNLPKRPYAFEVILSSCDAVQLAACDDYEASLWQEDILHTVSLGGHLIDSDGLGPAPCCIVVCDEHVVAVKEVPGFAKLLGSADIIDLVAIHSDRSVANCVLMEFGIVDASKSCGDWVIVFETEDECEKFIDVMRWRVSCILKVDLKVQPIRELSLIKKLRLVSEEIGNAKTKLKELCYESSPEAPV